jgi:hypothetical protein
MIAISETAVDNIAIPDEFYDIRAAAADPLTHPSLLRKIFAMGNNLVDLDEFPVYLSDLSSNPALPQDIFDSLLDKVQVLGDRFLDKTLAMEIFSYFFSNPLTTFEQELSAICISKIFDEDLESPAELSSCKTVVEVFDKLILVVKPKRSNSFLTKLLCSPLVSDEDFKFRVEDKDVRSKLDNWDLLDNPRFVPSAADYDAAFSFITNGQGKLERGVLGVLMNKNASPEFLVKVLKHKGAHKAFVYENLVCPIELSASYHSERLREYKWRLSYVVGLEAKVDEYLVRTQGEGPWGDLPLSWKLEMVRPYESGK